MGDGHLGKCRECTKQDATDNRNANIERVRAYDRKRGNRQGAGYLKSHRAKYPKQTKAHVLVGNAIRDGRLERGVECNTCKSTEKLHSHHDDYDKPLDLRWLCAACHRQWHRDNGEALNRA